MRLTRSSFLFRAMVAFAVLALVVSFLAQGITVAAQSGETAIEGSPASLEEPPNEQELSDEPTFEADAGGSTEPVTALVAPVAITVDTTALNPLNDPCSSIDSRWVAVLLAPVTDVYWTSSDGAAGGNIFVDASTEPDSFSWDTLGGGTVEGVIVADALGASAVSANFYDYRPFGGSVGGDAGLGAPSGVLAAAYLCLVGLPPASVSRPRSTQSKRWSRSTRPPFRRSPASTPASGTDVQAAAIGIGSSVGIAEPLNLRTAPAWMLGSSLSFLPERSLPWSEDPSPPQATRGGSSRPRPARAGRSRPISSNIPREAHRPVHPPAHPPELRRAALARSRSGAGCA